MPRLPSPLRSTAVPRSCLYFRSRWHAGSDVSPNARLVSTHTTPPPPPHPHPTLTQSLPNPEAAITPATFTPDPLNPIPATTCCHHHHQKPPPPPSGIGLRWLRTDTAIYVSDTQSWVFNCCHHGTDLLLDPPKGRPQNGVHHWIRNGPLKRCPPTVGGHSLGGVKWTPKVAPI